MTYEDWTAMIEEAASTDKPSDGLLLAIVDDVRCIEILVRVANQHQNTLFKEVQCVTSPKFLPITGLHINLETLNPLEKSPPRTDTKFYSDWDEELETYFVVGTETGFAYSHHDTKEQADTRAEEMTKAKTKTERCENK